MPVRRHDNGCVDDLIRLGVDARTRRRTIGSLLALLAIVLVVLGAAPAGAHAVLVSSSPADGASLDAAPEEVRLEFSEAVSADLGGIRVFDGAGNRVDEGAVEVDGSTVRVALRAGLGDGAYVATWRVVSADAHPVRGGFVFSVGDAAADPALLSRLLADGADRWWELAGGAGRWVAYTGTLLAAGGAAFLALVHRRAESPRVAVRAVRIAALLGGTGIVVALPIQAALATGQGPGALFQPGVLRSVLGDGVGWATAVGLVGLGLVAGGLRTDRRVAIAGAALAAGSFALTGHNRASDVPALATISGLVHLWAAAAWFGGLVLLALLLRPTSAPTPRSAGAAVTEDAEEAELASAIDDRWRRELVARFSTFAAAALVVVAVAGLALTWAEVRSVAALTSTDHGVLLLVKVAIAVVVLAIAAYNNRVLTPTVRTGRNQAAVPRLRRLVAAESVLLLVVLGVTAVLVNVTPARTAAPGGAIVERIVDLGDAGSVQIVIDPARAGTNVVHVYTYDPEGRPGEIADEVELEAVLPAEDIGPLVREPFRAGPAHLQLDDDLFVTAGEWELTVRARIDRFTEVTGTTDVPIGR